MYTMEDYQRKSLFLIFTIQSIWNAMEMQSFLPDKSTSVVVETNKTLWLYNPFTPDYILKKIYDSCLSNDPVSNPDNVMMNAYADSEFSALAIDKLVSFSKLLEMFSIFRTVLPASELWKQTLLHTSKFFTNDSQGLLSPLKPLSFSNIDALTTYLNKV